MKKNYVYLVSVMLSSSYMVGAETTSFFSKSGKYYGYHMIRVASAGLLLAHHYPLWISPLGREITQGISDGWKRGWKRGAVSTSLTDSTSGSSYKSWVSSSGDCSKSSSSSCPKSSYTPPPTTSSHPGPIQTSCLQQLIPLLKNSPQTINTVIGDVGKGITTLTGDIIKNVGGAVITHGGIQLGLFVWSHKKIQELEALEK